MSSAGEKLGEAVEAAIAEHGQWFREARPYATPQPRVFVTDGGKPVLRRPFKVRGEWFVRFAGTARLTAPFRGEGGWLYFVADWSWPAGSPESGK